MRQNQPSSSDTGLAPWRGNDPATQRSGMGYSPWDLMRQMQNDMDRLFGMPLATTAAGSLANQWSPSVDLSENDQEYRLEVELPGVNSDDINVQIQDHQLMISAQLNQGDEDPGNRRYYRRERRYGYFQEVLPLPANVDEQAIRAELHNGVLICHFPKAQQTQQQGRRISIDSGSGQAVQASRPANSRQSANVQQPPVTSGTNGQSSQNEAGDGTHSMAAAGSSSTQQG